MQKFNNLIQATQYFSSQERCVEYLTSLRWSDGVVTCVHCNSDKCYTLKGATKRYKCASCRKQFSATKGTIFESSTMPLQKWFIAIYLLTSHKKGISSLQLSKDLGITQKSAWFMLQRIRFALQTKSFNKSELQEVVEIDETFVGGEMQNMHVAKRKQLKGKGRGYTNKSTVFGMLERGGNVMAGVVSEPNREVLKPIILANISSEAVVVTDNFGAYKDLKYSFKKHVSVSHSIGQYVKGIYHTNGIEGFWSLLKRGIVGIYHNVSVKHLDKYVDEFEFRYNTRKNSEVERFENMLSLSNTRLTYSNLIS